ncbi:DUF1819 family protein [Marininema halotolerans]|uniref:Putative inner membrane protein n=1 Tax=Marininema halotolerans TaxID=1155944 RepID=A0A1I6R3V0_9BACL|nr:DUF1819 family protein [Marininema halotolerans]SFS59304.1 Putative inner membrane protein [Marininema halotolerans]
MSVKQDYSAGFISGSDHLLRYELKLYIQMLQNGLSSEEIRHEVLTNNLFQQRSHRGLVSLFARTRNRAGTLNSNLQYRLLTGTNADRNAILLYAFLRCYRLVREFAYEVIIFNYQRGKGTVEIGDVADFFARKEEQSVVVRRYTHQTKQKMRQVILKAMVDSEWLELGDNGEWNICPFPLSEGLIIDIRKEPECRMLAELSLTGVL